jgi:hypothetical protein
MEDNRRLARKVVRLVGRPRLRLSDVPLDLVADQLGAVRDQTALAGVSKAFNAAVQALPR